MITIAIPAFNNPGFTETAVRAAIHSTQQIKLPATFLLIDDAGDIGEPTVSVFQRVRSEHPGLDVRIVKTRRNLGYPGSFSLSLALSRTELTLFLSNDMLLTPSYLLAVIAVAAVSADFGCVRGSSRHTDALPEHVVVPPADVVTYDDLKAFAALVQQVNGLSYIENPLLCGDAVLIKRAVIERIGIHDLSLSPYFSDVDYGMRAQMAGFKLVGARGAWLHHEGAGYARREAERSGLQLIEARDRRMQQVRDCWAKFRSKWSGVAEWTDASVSPHEKTDYRTVALRNVGNVPVRLDPPASLLDAVEMV